MAPPPPAYLWASALPDPYLHIAYAIILAYSVLEELGLAMPQGRKSRDDNAEWIPDILSDLKARLLSAGVDLDENVHWRRGDDTQLEERRRKRSRDRTPAYARVGCQLQGIDQIAVWDAIAHVSWLRSCISSHRLSNGAKQLSEYDALNSQMLARRILLEAIGLPQAPGRRKYIY